MQKNDYRLTSHSAPYDIQRAKKELRKRISKEHPRATNMYRTIRDNKEYMDVLGSAYNDRCAYCGTPTCVAGKLSFQIDHIIPESSGALDDIEINEVDNLAYSCSSCNSHKDDFLPPKHHRKTLSPDIKIGSTFTRAQDYSIRLNSEHLDSDCVREFYQKMRFGNELRRVDFLLAGATDLIDHLNSNSPIENKLRSDITKELRAFIGLIQPLRNTMRI